MPEYYKSIAGENMFDFEEFYTSIAEQLPNHCNIAEVGCADGRSAIYLAECLQSLNKEFDLHMIDNMAYGGPDQRNTLINHIAKSGIGPFVQLMDMDSLVASCKFPDQLLDLVFLDSSHKYEETKAEIRLWHRKIVHGGILAGHDYTSIENPGVREAVRELISPEHLITYATRNNNGIWSVIITPEFKLNDCL